MEAIKKILRTPSAFVLFLVAIVSLIGVIIKSETDKEIARIPIDATLTAEARLTEIMFFSILTQTAISPPATFAPVPTSSETPTPILYLTTTLIPPSNSYHCSWTKTLVGTWTYDNSSYITFESSGIGYYYPQDNRENATYFEWTCLENGNFKNLTGGSEYKLEFPNNNSYIMNGDLWTRSE